MKTFATRDLVIGLLALACAAAVIFATAVDAATVLGPAGAAPPAIR